MHRLLSTRLARPGLLVLATAAAAAGALTAASSEAVAAGPPACQTGGLVTWLDTNGNGTAGSIYYTLNFTNLSGRRCTLRGYPGVSAVNLRGGQIGKPATRDTFRRAKTISIRNGGTATTSVRIVDNGAISNCGMVTAAGLRVFALSDNDSVPVRGLPQHERAERACRQVTPGLPMRSVLRAGRGRRAGGPCPRASSAQEGWWTMRM
jgi:hypothetical protein